jgi:carbamoylphosphate synthase large subunit
MKNILLGCNPIYPDWISNILTLKNQPYITVCNFYNDNVDEIIKNKQIDIIIPLSQREYEILDKIKAEYKQKIIYPSKNIIELFHSKINFTKWMMEKFVNNIPKVYILENNVIDKDILFPIITKPNNSICGSNMEIYKNINEFASRTSINIDICQEYIQEEDEYGGFFICVNGKIMNKIILHLCTFKTPML